MIKIACKVQDRIPLDSLEPFQGELKSLSQENHDRLKNEILTTGFAFPVYAWRSPSDGRCFIVGGHQRVKVLKELRDKDGIDIGEVPVVFIEAESEREAKRRILQDVAQYGEINSQGLYDFARESELSLQDLQSFRLPDFDLVQFGENFFPDELTKIGVVTNPENEWKGMPEFTQTDKTSFRHIIVHFPDQAAAAEFFALIRQNDTGETKTVWFPPQERMDTEAKRYDE